MFILRLPLLQKHAEGSEMEAFAARWAVRMNARSVALTWAACGCVVCGV